MLPKLWVLTIAAGACVGLAELPRNASAVGVPIVHCAPGDPLVWLNTNTHIYHIKGSPLFGKTKAGKYACTSQARALGARAAGIYRSSVQTLPDGSRDTAVVRPGHTHHQSLTVLQTLPNGQIITPHTRDSQPLGLRQTLPDGETAGLPAPAPRPT
jgi:hypothetical protein